jgi:hypothetical protein
MHYCPNHAGYWQHQQALDDCTLDAETACPTCVSYGDEPLGDDDDLLESGGPG